jgi:hypothetical protein
MMHTRSVRKRRLRRMVDHRVVEMRRDIGRYTFAVTTRRTRSPIGVSRNVRVVDAGMVDDTMAGRDPQEAQNIEPEEDSSEQQAVRDGSLLNHDDSSEESTSNGAEVKQARSTPKTIFR